MRSALLPIPKILQNVCKILVDPSCAILYFLNSGETSIVRRTCTCTGTSTRTSAPSISDSETAAIFMSNLQNLKIYCHTRYYVLYHVEFTKSQNILAYSDFAIL